MDSPRISIVIPLYNKAAYVQRAIESVLAQGEGVLEVVVVDDGSTDDSAAKVVALHNPKVRLVKKPNGGVSSARNRGIEEARGEFVAFLDADDVYLPGFINEILNLIERFPDSGVYATSYCRRWPDGHTLANYLPCSIDSNHAQIVQQPYKAWSRASFFHIGSLCVRRDIFFQRDIFFPLGESIGEDQDVIFRLIETSEITFSPKPLMAYTQEVANSLYSVLPDYIPPCYLRLAERMKSNSFPANQRKGAVRLLSVSYLNVARSKINRGKRKRAMRVLFHPRAFFHWTYWIRTLVRFCLPVSVFRSGWMRRI